MKIGIGNYYLNRYGAENGARIMAEHGYECIDFNLSDTETDYYSAKEEFFFVAVNKIRAALNKSGITVNQIHGPWRFPPRDATEDDRAERFGKMTKAAAIAKYLGAKYMIVHPLMPFGIDENINPDEVYEINKKFFTALSDVVGKLGVTVCLENMPFKNFSLSSTSAIITLIKDINNPHLKFCFDTGHANLIGEDPRESVLTAGGDLLKTVHIHDNLSDTDSHLPPYDGNIDWAEFMEALYDIGYVGTVNLETAPQKISGFDKMTAEQIKDAELSIAKVAKLLAGI